ncbi:tetratricopeptide repeat protein [Aphanizomenon sp. PH219]|nr:tetratricopeptide repeat protein [Aphanizomenon sp. 202]MDK2461254.1 tetratricopeptide repeat protein [Aphanizomenon sp. PH219]
MIKFTAITLALALITFPFAVMAQTAKIQSISGTGKVRLQREKRTDWIPVRPATDLYQGDQILPDRGVKVYVRCPDWSKPVLVRTGVPSGMGSICPTWVSRDSRGSQTVGILGGINPDIPYLITPRHSLLLSRTPLIRWHQVSGVAEYTIEVTGATGLMWKTKTKETQLVYAGKPLAAGVPYSIIIRTNTGKSSQEDNYNSEQKATNLEFRILRKSEAEVVKSATAQIASSSLNNEADALTLANFYSNYVLPQSVIQAYQLPDNTFETYSLTGDAIAILESLVQKGKQSVLIYRTLGDLYWQTGLVRLAETNYLKAIDLVQGLEDMEDWTLAQSSLGQVYAAIDDYKKALEHFNQARVGYIFLGDNGRAEVLQRQMKRINKTSANSQEVKN